MTRSTSRLRLLAAALVLVVFAAACGSSEDTSSDTGADTGSADTGSADTSAADTSAADVEVDNTSASVDANVAAFCAGAAEQDARQDAFNDFDPVAVQEFVRTSGSAMLDAIEIAPAEIADDMQVLADGLEQFYNVLKDNDWDIFAASAELDAIDESPEQVAASDAVDAWRAENCGTPLPSDEPAVADNSDSIDDVLSTPEGISTILGSEAGREMFITGMTEDGSLTVEQATCLVDSLDADGLAALIGDVEPTAELMVAVLEIMSSCGIAP